MKPFGHQVFASEKALKVAIKPTTCRSPAMFKNSTKHH